MTKFESFMHKIEEFFMPIVEKMEGQIHLQALKNAI